MAAHRYWGLLFTPRAGSGNGISLAEVEMRASTGGADLCTGGTAGGLSTGGQVPANAFDDNNATLWYYGAASPNVRLTYDFGTPVSVVEVFVRNAAISGSGSGFPGTTYGPAGCWVQWSDDGTAWSYGPPATDLSGLGNDGTATITGVSDAVPPARLDGGESHILTSWPPTGLVYRGLGTVARLDAVDGGAYRVAGTVAIDGTPAVPVRRRVRLLHERTGRLVREAWSAEDGTFEFAGLALAEYIVLTDDHTRLYNAVVADKVTAVV